AIALLRGAAAKRPAPQPGRRDGGDALAPPGVPFLERDDRAWYAAPRQPSDQRGRHGRTRIVRLHDDGGRGRQGIPNHAGEGGGERRRGRALDVPVTRLAIRGPQE